LMKANSAISLVNIPSLPVIFCSPRILPMLMFFILPGIMMDGRSGFKNPLVKVCVCQRAEFESIIRRTRYCNGGRFCPGSTR
jgi:hypothetical protein